MLYVFLFFIMKIVKFIVFIYFITCTTSFRVSFCGICSNHTLCKYTVDGPSSKCVNYDRTSVLTSRNIADILNRINERRHLVASGMLNHFPQAANMKKIRWSAKLAIFAQRWADQCDPFLKPSKEDECRDLVNMKVGQNIATVLGSSSGLSVKSFVDIWFMLNLHFVGSVAYYNQSKNSITNYFTQLIWADTAFVGCGRVKFFVNKANTIVERLVCNFAPKGNIQGKPIYTIGYPGTQCPNQMIPDAQFPSLCLQSAGPATKFTNESSSASSLLRILNLSNNSLKQELDPNNLKQIHLNSSETNDQRNQKTRHVYPSNSYGAMKRDSVHFQNSRNMENYNDPQYPQRQFTQERGHSRMYHGYQTSKEPMYTMNTGHEHAENDFRRTYYTTSGPFYSNSVQDARKHYVDSQCTRKMILNENHNCFSPDPPCKSKSNDCTRQNSQDCPQPNPCQRTTLTRPNKQCSCNEPPPVRCDCNQKCQPTTNCPSFTTTYCPYRRVGGDEPDKSNKFDNYDLFHNLEVKSGEDDTTPKPPWRFENSNPIMLDKADYNSRESELRTQVKAIVDDSLPKTRKFQDLYSSFDYSKRKKRELEDQTFKPFWQMDEYNQKRPSELKSIRYTTLGSKKYRKLRKTTTTISLPTSTETITIKPKDKSTVHYSHRGRVTEKYLSFDELMHLRKLSTVESMDMARRKGDSHDALREGYKGPANETITANTPFIRMKHCTRKLTCTWTAAIGGGNGTGGGPGGGGIDIGSRTPPGYVDGCTRTSTCTRDHMDRNKMATSSEGPNGGTIAEEDEDYCERRSLNIRRRNLDENVAPILRIGYQDAKNKVLTTKTLEIVTDAETNVQNNAPCICYEDAARIKRGEFYNFDELLEKGRFGVKFNRKLKRLNKDGIVSTTHLSSGSKKKLTLDQCPCDGTKSSQNMFYGDITMKYCVTWMFYRMVTMRSFGG